MWTTTALSLFRTMQMKYQVSSIGYLKTGMIMSEFHFCTIQIQLNQLKIWDFYILPQEVVTKEKYEEYVAQLKPINMSSSGIIIDDLGKTIVNGKTKLSFLILSCKFDNLDKLICPILIISLHQNYTLGDYCYVDTINRNRIVLVIWSVCLNGTYCHHQ